MAGVAANAMNRDSLVHAAAHRANVESNRDGDRKITLGNATGFSERVLVKGHTVREGSSHASSDDEG